MINRSNFPPPVPPAGWVPPAPVARSTNATSPAAWFDSSGVGADTRISADLSLDSRGLSVEQHAARVLQHLCGERDEGV